MTITTAHPGHHHISVKATALAFAGALLAVGAGFGIASVVLDDEVLPITPAPAESEFDLDRYPGFDPNGYAGTNREDRAFQHRR
ncbi:hypothetical protein [Nocardioides coralli]|uniref:hypothetical protein n=1 Tax=Nocardioides coralli TaxID=2872154 RepID=UPI001CA407D2|nr:hypothetical protein [Nocardioides coralli]QZY29720.1 hypothetical protein K6T13_03230 [Nocardioides coralli]